MFFSRGIKCVICSKIGDWQPTILLLSDPPIGTEHMCDDCSKACADATEQKKYLRRYHRDQKK